MRVHIPLIVMVAGSCLAVACTAPGQGSDTRTAGPEPPVVAIAASGATDPVPHDPDDPAVWVDAADPAASLIIGTDKMEGRGGLYVFGLDRRLRVFRIGRGSRRLEEITTPGGIPVLEGQHGEAGEPMGIGLYKRAADGAVFAIVSPKTGGLRDYLWQYRLREDGRGRVAGTLVRRFGSFSGPKAGAGEIEAVAVDDELGFVYYADERFGIRKWAADPDGPDASRELAVLGADGYLGDREGLAIFAAPGGGGYIVSSDQVPGSSRIHLYTRSGGAGAPHAHRRLGILGTAADETDGLEVISTPVGAFPRGLLVMMNSGPKTFLIFSWSDVESAVAGAGARAR